MQKYAGVYTDYICYLKPNMFSFGLYIKSHVNFNSYKSLLRFCYKILFPILIENSVLYSITFEGLNIKTIFVYHK